MSDGTADTGAGDQAGGNASPCAPEIEPLDTVPLAGYHRTSDFSCAKSARVQGFFVKECSILIERGYCRVFIFEDPNDKTKVLGYYTLSAALIEKVGLSRSDEKRSPFGFSAPMVRIGFLGKDDSAPKGLGTVLIIDAARRVSRNGDIGACGIILEPEGAHSNSKLMKWYLDQGFKACRGNVTSLYAPLSALTDE